jgi:triphosphatase
MKEIELKFDCSPGDSTTLATLLDGMGAQRGVRKLLSTYYDTPEAALRSAGISLRVRRSGDRFVQTIKRLDGDGGLFERDEWETEVSADRLDPGAFEGTALAGFPGLPALGPVFSVAVRRTLWDIRSGEAEVEAALDRGEARTADRSETFDELELEVKRGEASALFDLVPSLAGVPSLRLGIRSKSDRGYALLPCSGARRVAAGPSSGESALAASLVRFRQAELNLPAAGPGPLAAAVEDMASSLAALPRSAPDPELARLEEEVGWLYRHVTRGDVAILDTPRCRNLVFSLARAAWGRETS